METNGLHHIEGEVVYKVSGYFLPDPNKYFTDKEEALDAAHKLELDNWSSVVTVVKQEMVYISKK